jgi:hypothetical protein
MYPLFSFQVLYLQLVNSLMWTGEAKQNYSAEKDLKKGDETENQI